MAPSFTLGMRWKGYISSETSGNSDLGGGRGENPGPVFLTASLNDATTPIGYRKDLLFLQIGFRVSKPSKDRSAKNHWPLATSKSKVSN